MEESTFRYRDTGQNPLKHCSSGIYYKSARGDDQELEQKCVIMNWKNDDLDDDALSQIKLSRRMGYEYALEVLHIDNSSERSALVKVIYPDFEDTMSKWLGGLKANGYQPPANMQYEEWMKTELVMPKIKKLWKLLHEMKENNIHICMEENDQGYYMPLISGVPKLLNLREGDNHEKDYAKNVLDKIVTSDEAHDLSEKFRSALAFWNGEITIENTTTLNYQLCFNHPVFYDPADKKRFLLLINDIIFRYGLKGWLNGEEKDFNWMHFHAQINAAPHKDVYQQILHYKAGQSRGLVSTKGTWEESPHYSAGSDIVRFTRNALIHFEENSKNVNNNTTWDCGLNDGEREIVEILDDELNVCSLHYAIAKIIIVHDPPEKYTVEGWKKYQEEKWIKLKQRHSKAEEETKAEAVAKAKAKAEAVAKAKAKAKGKAKGKAKAEAEAEAEAQGQALEVISQAYQPAQLKLKDRFGNWMEPTEIIRFYQPLSLFKKNQPDHWVEATEIKAARAGNDDSTLDVSEFYTRENSKVDWKKFEEIKEKHETNQPLELLTNKNISGRQKSGWMEVKEFFRHLKPPQLFVDVDRTWMEATDILKEPQPPRLYTKEGCNLGWMELEKIKNKANQPLELHVKNGGQKGWKKLEEIKNDANQRLVLFTKDGWKQATEIIKADQPPSLEMRGQGKPFWMEAFEADRPAEELLTREDWFDAREELEEFFKSLK